MGLVLHPAIREIGSHFIFGVVEPRRSEVGLLKSKPGPSKHIKISSHFVLLAYYVIAHRRFIRA